jgi:hypothetical protein
VETEYIISEHSAQDNMCLDLKMDTSDNRADQKYKNTVFTKHISPLHSQEGHIKVMKFKENTNIKYI